MRRSWPRLIVLLFFATLAMPAASRPVLAAEVPGINWTSDLEAAKTLAKQSNRLVLVHFWTPSCAPCVTLEQTVFNQEGVASAIEQRFVPVKLNANENSATATGFGITRVPTDVVLTPDGHMVGKLISPPTPAGYIAELSQLAAAYSSTPGQGFANAAARAPAPSQINAAYANLPIGSGMTATEVVKSQTPTVPPAAVGTRDPFQAASTVNNSFAAPTNPALQPVATGNPAMATTIPAPAFAPPPVAPMPREIDNRYAAAPAATSPPPPATQAPSPAWPTAPQEPPLSLISGSGSALVSSRPVAAQSPPLALQQSTIGMQTQAGAGASDGRQLPPGAPPLGFDGFCPVSMRNHWKWVPGDSRWGIVHRGRTYWFATQAEQQQFWADPDRYSPALSGMDPVLALDHQQQVPGKREHSIDYDGLFYMFSSEATLAQFTANPERYAASVRQAMGIPRGRLVR